MIKKSQWMGSVLLALCLLFGAVAAVAEVQIADEAIEEATDDLIVSYHYPAFTAGDQALTERLHLLITQAFLDRYETLYAEYTSFAADRTEEQAALYKSDDTYRDELYGDYQVLSNDERLLQIIAPASFWPAGGNGNWTTTQSYVFDMNAQRLLALPDLFEEDADSVYAALTEAAQAQVSTIDGAYDDAVVEVSVLTPFYITQEDSVLHLMFNPYSLSPSEVEIPVLLTALPLTSVDAVAAQAEEDTPLASMPNPMRETTADEVATFLGKTLSIPEKAEDTAYYLYEFGGSGDSAEVQFTIDGVPYVYSARPSDGLVDLSGMYVPFATIDENAKVGDSTATLKLNEGAQGMCIWYDASTGLSNSLIMLKDASAQTLTDVAGSL